ncbi:hypothetical protein CU14913_000626 [Campylobacter upsaliensis]|nr:hypothetical protein [Campylobacter upsaliensis]CAG9468502.1 hypothetical protein CU14913_000626 [Campylobacter upsaliensis]
MNKNNLFRNLWERRKNRLRNSFDKRLGKYFVKHYSKIQQNYNFIFFSYTASGQYAFAKFLMLCGLNQAHLAKDGELHYNDAVNNLKNSTQRNFIAINHYQSKKSVNYSHFLSDSVPIVITLRDPIQRTLSVINKSVDFKSVLKNRKKLYRLSDDINKALCEPTYGFLFNKAYYPANIPSVSLTKVIIEKINFNYQSDLTPFLTNKGGGGVSLAKLFTSIRKIYKQIKPLTR